MNPEAPASVKQYSFMIGVWQCADRARQNDGWREFISFSTGEWFLNGYGALNRTYTPDSASAMARTEWTGKRLGESMIATSATPDGRNVMLQITEDRRIQFETYDADNWARIDERKTGPQTWTPKYKLGAHRIACSD